VPGWIKRNQSNKRQRYRV